MSTVVVTAEEVCIIMRLTHVPFLLTGLLVLNMHLCCLISSPACNVMRFDALDAEINTKIRKI